MAQDTTERSLSCCANDLKHERWERWSTYRYYKVYSLTVSSRRPSIRERQSHWLVYYSHGPTSRSPEYIRRLVDGGVPQRREKSGVELRGC